MRTITFDTTREIAAVDITDLLTADLADLPDGFVWISCPHTTGALILCESDPEMLSDIERVAGGLLAPYEPFSHRKNDNPNAAAHLFSSLMGTQLVLPVASGALHLGTYQRLIFVELDGPRSRRLELSPIAPSA